MYKVVLFTLCQEEQEFMTGDKFQLLWGQRQHQRNLHHKLVLISHYFPHVFATPRNSSLQPHHPQHSQSCLFLEAKQGPAWLVRWKHWCWSWNSNTSATWCEEQTHLKRPWCWEKLKAGGEGNDRGWDGWMASQTQWTWVWVDSGSWWWTGRPGVLWFMGSQRVGHDWATELNWYCVHIREAVLTRMTHKIIEIIIYDTKMD